ncbi:MAG: ribosome small subunit-dependent GTPase A [Bacteroidales bacterium]|nr:ribosome small subunit-dependent GTPase A [Bacteroidales bacterium]
MSSYSESTGLVVRSTGSWYHVMPDSGATLPCRLRGNYRLHGSKQTNPIAVGDRVDFQLLDDGTGLITDIHDRRNYIVRRSTNLSKQTHVIAANIDLLCIVATLGFPRTSSGFIDRLLVTAEAYHIPAAIIFNKCDLYDDELWQFHNDFKHIYSSVGYPVLEVSALSGLGLDSLKQLIAGQTVLFSGHSGVGKSAILNAIDPSLHLRTGEVSQWSLKGTHTTTFAEIHPISISSQQGSSHQPDISNPPSALQPSTFLIDTPGIKEFGMVDFQPWELSHFFPEMRPLILSCRFANCTHRHEPGCAVKAAVETGQIPSERYQNYLNILDSIISSAPLRR